MNEIRGRSCLYSDFTARRFAAIFNHYEQVVTGDVTTAVITTQLKLLY